ncbi:hypothetical protein [Dickeya lacustris]|uniref:Uncharacterized protein n=1 Tax=Dickeya lacustris TaxID=2259638 RepID=A0ABY8G3G6_9GAMM|nr:hypothetical protein [Dickeya lacustris]WFN54464.1 hypothetical protein O1Q98_12305 [Dickeya lacustris]
MALSLTALPPVYAISGDALKHALRRTRNMLTKTHRTPMHIYAKFMIDNLNIFSGIPEERRTFFRKKIRAVGLMTTEKMPKAADEAARTPQK